MGSLVTSRNMTLRNPFFGCSVHSGNNKILSGNIVNMTVVYVQSIQSIFYSLTQISKDVSNLDGGKTTLERKMKSNISTSISATFPIKLSPCGMHACKLACRR